MLKNLYEITVVLETNKSKAKRAVLVIMFTIFGILVIPEFDAVYIVLFAALALDMFNFVSKDEDESKIEVDCMNCNTKLEVNILPKEGIEITCEKCSYVNTFVRFAVEKELEVLDSV